MIIKYTNILLYLVCFLTLAGCGGSDDAAPSGPPLNAAGYPDVIGTYAFNTSSFSYTCTDSITGTDPAVSFNVGVSQSINSLSFENKSTGGSPGVTIIESSGLTGNITKSASFTASENATANVDGIAGIVHINWNISGSFTAAAWSGNYEYTVTTTTFACTSKATFSGDKISATASIVTPNDLQPDNYEPYQAIGRAVGN